MFRDASGGFWWATEMARVAAAGPALAVACLRGELLPAARGAMLTRAHAALAAALASAASNGLFVMIAAHYALRGERDAVRAAFGTISDQLREAVSGSTVAAAAAAADGSAPAVAAAAATLEAAECWAELVGVIDAAYDDERGVSCRAVAVICVEHCCV